jgi:Fe-S oxidoreductase
VSLDDHKRGLGECTYCPKLCRFCCPVAEVEHKETVTPWGKMSLAEMVRLGRVDPGGEVGEVFYHCFACLHCRTHCTHRVDVPGALIEARARVLQSGGGIPAVDAVLGRFRDTGNATGEDLAKRLLDQIDERYLEPDAQAVIFFGCDALRLETNLPEQVFRLLEELGVDYVAAHVGEELCCGMPLWQAGDLEGFRTHAKKVQIALSRYRTIISPCPTCVYALSGLYAEMNLAPRASVLHLSSFLGPLLDGREPRQKLEGKYTYHDPCYLARHLEKTKLPREMLGRILNDPLLEPVWTGQDATCCGGGGLVPYTHPEVAKGAAEMRMDQLKKTGADRIITACPGCIRQLSKTKNFLPVEDITSLLIDAYCD